MIDRKPTAAAVTSAQILGTREAQEDAFFTARAGGAAFAAVCDGMGGMGGGAQAANTAIGTLKALLSAKDPGEPWPAFFLRAVDILDEQVAKITTPDGRKQYAGTTLAAVAVAGEALWWLSVGDSRLYILRDGELAQITRDHNCRLVEPDAEKARGEALISFIGMGGVEIMDRNEAPFALLPGDALLLCSDGVTKALTDSEILHILRHDAGADALIQAALAKKLRNRDNTTAVVIRK